MDAQATVAPGPDHPPLWRRLTAWGAGLVLAGLTVIAGCRALDIDATTPVPQLLAFLPWLLVPGALALGAAALARWRLGLVWAVAVLAVTAWFLQPYDPAGSSVASARADGREAARITVLTSNVLFGRATSELVDAVRRERPDLVFVQECDAGCLDLLRTELGYPHESAVPSPGSHGSAILSRYPLVAEAGIASRLEMPGALATIAGQKVRLQLAHPVPPVPGGVGVWRRELGAMRDWVVRRRSSAPLVVAGDFNASQDHAAFRQLLDAGLRDAAAVTGQGRTPSWPATVASPFGTQIDHVLTSPSLEPRAARFLELAGTDHRALVVELVLYAG
ncbi:endonuclease/exonuclease/phosphatase family protein [Streptomyces sp. TRM66268-LWL]|uniref:Endonuclease/exonuclease/phosphatase family protein n=1 Tax=Streptomyces polyasparticus TaxID=2767826 RepID=A0ABR7SIH9_9ACTN|nr:endonuclease/exonuclease/phosphatase family protein [Streptomyces polyasparticus]MBC9714372.1 endonuclease/exonuclease/phosphatase family protein [Streptomyces polyasparticus]